MKKIFWYFIFFSFSLYTILTLSVYAAEIDIVTSDISAQAIVPVHVTDITYNSANIEWGRVDWYNWYTLYYDTKPSMDDYKYHSSVLMWTWTILKNLIPNTDYYLVIKAFDNHANEVLISKEIKFTTADWITEVNWASDLIKNWDKWQGLINTSSSIINENMDSTVNNEKYGAWVNPDWITWDNKEQIKKLPKTWPTSYVIIIVALMLSFTLMNFSKMKFNLKK